MEKQGVREKHMFSLFAEMILDKAVKEYEKKRVYEQINEALETGDKQAFLQLSEHWRKLLD